jgi:hypothetical protein
MFTHVTKIRSKTSCWIPCLFMFIHELGSSVRLPIQIWESFKHT